MEIPVKIRPPNVNYLPTCLSLGVTIITVKVYVSSRLRVSEILSKRLDTVVEGKYIIHTQHWSQKSTIEGECVKM